MPATATFLMMTVTIILNLVILTRLYWAYVEADELFWDQECCLLRQLLSERNDWQVRHLSCGFGAVVLVWVSKSLAGWELPSALDQALAVYAASSLVFAVLESLLALKISRQLMTLPVPVQNRR